MDFRSRGAGAPATSSSSSAPNSFSSQSNGLGSSPSGSGIGKWLQRSTVALLFGLTIVIAAVAVFAAIGGSNQANAVKKDKYQAVFLNNGQVYFGHIRELNKSYVNLTNIYYLQTNNSSSDQSASATPTNVTLVKLGCELHGPYDQMLINDSQVLFWENLQDSSQVVQKIKQLPKCTPATASSTQQAPNNSAATQPTTSTGTGATSPTPTPSSTKKP